jgi:hypothetical protein
MKLFPIQAETQPIAGLIGLLIILRYGIKKSVYSITLLWLMFIIVGYYVVSIILRPLLFFDVTLNTIAYFIPLFVFLSLYDKIDLLSPKLYFIVLYVWLAVGIIQYFSFFGFLKPVLNAVLGSIISRYTSSPLGGARGVVFFSQEPSAASTSITLFMLTAIFFYTTRRISRMNMWLAMSVSVIMTFLNKSASGMVTLSLFPLCLLVSYIIAFVRRLRSLTLPREVIYVPLWVTLIVVVVWASTVSLKKRIGYTNRIFEVAPVAWERVVVRRDVSLLALGSVGGFRFPVMYVGYRSLGQNYALGHGAASWLTDFDRVARSCGVFLENFPLMASEKALKVVKPNAYGAALAFDTGMPGLFFFLLFLSLFLFSKFKTKVPPSVSALTSVIVIVSVFKLLATGLITLPTWWLGLCYVYHIKNSVPASASSALRQ